MPPEPVTPRSMPFDRYRPGALRIGANTIWPEEAFQGLIDEVRVYNRALTAAEVTDDMNRRVNITP